MMYKCTVHCRKKTDRSKLIFLSYIQYCEEFILTGNTLKDCQTGKGVLPTIILTI